MPTALDYLAETPKYQTIPKSTGYFPAAMPANLAQIAQRNLAQEDKLIQNFNRAGVIAATPASPGVPAATNVPRGTNFQLPPPTLGQQISNYRPQYGGYSAVPSPARTLYGAYRAAPSPTPTSYGAYKTAGTPTNVSRYSSPLDYLSNPSNPVFSPNEEL